MRTALRIDAFLGQTQALHGPAADEMLLDDRGGIPRLNMAVPDCFWINDDRRSMFTLIKTPGLIDAHFGAEARRLYKLLQLGM